MDFHNGKWRARIGRERGALDHCDTPEEAADLVLVEVRRNPSLHYLLTGERNPKPRRKRSPPSNPCGDPQELGDCWSDRSDGCEKSLPENWNTHPSDGWGEFLCVGTGAPGAAVSPHRQPHNTPLSKAELVAKNWGEVLPGAGGHLEHAGVNDEPVIALSPDWDSSPLILW